MKHLISLLTLACAASGVQAEELFVKGVVFPEGADSITKIELAGRVVPTPQQLAWQQRPLTAFLHFGMNTFTNREWGDGKESPELFNPKSLDTDQWVRTLKDAGFEMVILTAKHHDGFCLWPTATTSHSVASSPWRDGKGDVVADLRRSCDKYGMKLGLYLSPWDRNAQCYGSEAYNDLFVAQLTELLTNYGKVDEVWFDGACGEGPNGKKQVYDWLRFRDTMRDLQPDAVLAITGDDVRWVGNEGGRGRETEWSVTPLVPKVYAFADSVNKALDMNEMSPSLGGRDVVSRASQVFWWPAEVDVSIRPGWFYHETEQPHPMSRMARIYLESVGRNATLLLNIPPDTDGLISPADCQRLAEFHNWIQTNFQKKQLPGRINCVELREDITQGQRVEQFDVEVLAGGSWQKVAEGTTIGNRRILTFDPVDADSIRFNILSSRGEPHAEIVGTYLVKMPAAESDFKSPYPAVSATPVRKLYVADKQQPYYEIVWTKPQTLAGFVYTPVPGEAGDMIYRYDVEVSANGKKWTKVETTGEFGNIAANPIPQEVIFSAPVKARAIRLLIRETAFGETLAPSAISLTPLAPKE
ncbi:MAG: alpha-1,3/4-fucosidase [Bacteroides sp.]|nr:alpha-1,3/4-fucosidase [Bacteroides sp.]